MSKRLMVNKDNMPCYEIVYENSFDLLPNELEKFNIQNKKICIVTDSKVNELYGKKVYDILKDKCREIHICEFPNGEENKNLDTVKNIYEFLINKKFERKDMLLALGGGVVGDVTGFVAASYLRGVDFVQIPTTLLSQVDSSVGGKTGVDFNQYKNMVGAFKMPILVYMNISVLNTLDDTQYSSGLGEVIKYGLIQDRDFYNWLIKNNKAITDKDYDIIEEMVIKSCNYKRIIVEKDPTEKGDRALLNFGHTIGHAVEKAKNFELTHGACVALGSVAAAYISMKKNYISQEEYMTTKNNFKFFNLPTSVEGIDSEKIYELTTSDKKMEGNVIKFITLKSIGKAIIDMSVTKEEIIAGINEIYV